LTKTYAGTESSDVITQTVPISGISKLPYPSRRCCIAGVLLSKCGSAHPPDDIGIEHSKSILPKYHFFFTTPNLLTYVSAKVKMVLSHQSVFTFQWNISKMYPFKVSAPIKGSLASRC
jgi:hypothetical protein